MKINEFQRRIVGYYKSGLSIYLKGPIGRGKSTVIEGAGRLLSAALGGRYFVVVVSGPLLNPPDAVGYLMPRTIGDRFESAFTEPFFFRLADGSHISEYDGGIILVDEADKMDTDTKKIMGEACLSGRVGPHFLPRGVRVWMAGNRSEDRSGATKEYDHLINRRLEISLTDDIQALEDWMFTNKVHPTGIAFATSNPQVVFMEPPKAQGPWCTPRSLVQCISYLASLSNDDELPTDSHAVEEAAGMIGPDSAAQLFATIRLAKEMPKFEDIISKPTTTKVPSAPDAQMLVCYNLAARVDEKTITPVIKYIERMPAEFTITFGRAAFKREPDLISTDAFSEWISKNASLMMAITSNK